MVRTKRSKSKPILLFGAVLLLRNGSSSLAFTVEGTKPLHYSTALQATSSSQEGSTDKLRPGSMDAAIAEQGRVPYGESSRKYRRTVFGHDDWVAHRASDRMLVNLKGVFFSGVIRQVWTNVLLSVVVALGVVFWNQVLVAQGGLPALSLPSLPFTLSSPALGLLLVFKTNASYARWLEGRKLWSKIITQSQNTVRMASTFTNLSEPDGVDKLNRLGQAAWAFPRSLMNELSNNAEDEKDYAQQLMQVFSQDSKIAQSLIESDNRAVQALMDLSLALDALPIDEKRRVEIDKSLVIMGDCMGACQRIFTSPVPLVYTRHTARFLSLWMLLLPMSLYDAFESDQAEGWILVPAVAMMAIFLFGIEELSVQLEEPFSILPMQKFCDGIREATTVMRDRAMQNVAQSTDIQQLGHY